MLTLTPLAIHGLSVGYFQTIPVSAEYTLALHSIISDADHGCVRLGIHLVGLVAASSGTQQISLAISHGDWVAYRNQRFAPQFRVLGVSFHLSLWIQSFWSINK
jgi:hypothetical protein